MGDRKTVAVIGAGPSGLKAAKSMLEVGLQPTVFDSRSRVGGLWAPPEDGVKTHQLHPEMRVNSSQFLSTFSDYFPFGMEGEQEFKWFPTATELYNHLQGYAERFLTKEILRLGCPVVRIDKSEKGNENSSWRLTYRDTTTGEDNVETFAFLVIATGSMSHPAIPHANELGRFKGEVLHSAEYDGMKFFANPVMRKKKKIVIIGGSLSAGEVASDVALRAGCWAGENAPNIEIFHLISKPMWIVPKYVPFMNPDDPLAPKVLPIDVTFFTATAADALGCNSIQERALRLNGLLGAVLGGEYQAEISPDITFTEYWRKQPPVIALTDSYDKFVRAGSIKTILGRFAGITTDGDVQITSAYSEEKDRLVHTLSDIDTIIFATGYTPVPQLQSLFPLGYFPSMSNPAFFSTLYKGTLQPSKLGKTGGFVGMTRRPFWGSFDLQSRWLAGLFAGTIPWPSALDIADFSAGPMHLESIGKTNDALLKAGGSDYLDLVKDLSTVLNIQPIAAALVDHAPPPKPLIPAHLSSTLNDPDVVRAIETVYTRIASDATSPAHIARAIFSEFHGRWNIVRRLESRLPGFPEGIFRGTAEFKPRTPTPVAETPGVMTLGREILEYLYTEQGKLTPHQDSVINGGAPLEARKRYIYKFDESDSTISTYFVNLVDQTSSNGLFHSLNFEKEIEVLAPPQSHSASNPSCDNYDASGKEEKGWKVEQKGGWTAVGEHLCEKDWYWSSYRFVFRGARMTRFWIRYKVVGPRKEYVAEAEYCRD